MRRLIVICFLSLTLTPFARAQQDSADSPASKADIERLLDATNGRELLRLRLKAANTQLHEIVHKALKDRNTLPADFEPYLMNVLDNMMKDFTEDKLMQAAIPIYQKHLTKGDVDGLVAFYSSPVGQRILKEMPAVQTEAMQAYTSLLQPAMTKAIDRMQEEISRADRGDVPSTKKQPEQN